MMKWEAFQFSTVCGYRYGQRGLLCCWYAADLGAVIYLSFPSLHSSFITTRNYMGERIWGAAK